MEIIIGIVAGLTAGAGGSFLFFRDRDKKKSGKLIEEAQAKAAHIIKESKKENESIKKEKILQAKEKFLELKTKHEETIKGREEKMRDAEKRIKDKEHKLNEKLARNNKLKAELDKTTSEYKTRQGILKTKEQEVESISKRQVEMLEEVSGYSADKAKQELVELLKTEAKTKAAEHIQKVKEEAELNANEEAKKVVIGAIQRIGTEQAIENSVSVFNLDSDDIKGRIIGREGRNIRALESETGVEIIVDDTPEAIILSCFDPVRREIARLSLHNLVKDGRINPTRIEEVVSKTRKQIEQEIVSVGKRTAIDLGIHGLHPELIKVVGRMKYRSSYGQNLLQHSREVAELSATLASELGLDTKLAKRAGLLHDIGKVPEKESEHPHAILGMKWAEKYGEKGEVCNAIGAHHDEIEMTSLLSPIIQVADAISGARPGARRQLLEAYAQRLKELEDTALGFDGVEQAYAIQAGRELRVIVASDKIDDKKASLLSYEITDKIQNELTYPGQIRVTVIRETRAVNVAR